MSQLARSRMKQEAGGKLRQGPGGAAQPPERGQGQNPEGAFTGIATVEAGVSEFFPQLQDQTTEM